MSPMLYGSTAWWMDDGNTEVKTRRFRYTGKERDEETGLQDHGARRYIPWLGRWDGADPAGFVDGTNRYAYVSGNPVRLVDPTGRASMASMLNRARVAYNEVSTHVSDSVSKNVDLLGKTVQARTQRVVDQVEAVVANPRQAAAEAGVAAARAMPVTGAVVAGIDAFGSSRSSGASIPTAAADASAAFRAKPVQDVAALVQGTVTTGVRAMEFRGATVDLATTFLGGEADRTFIEAVDDTVLGAAANAEVAASAFGAAGALKGFNPMKGFNQFIDEVGLAGREGAQLGASETFKRMKPDFDLYPPQARGYVSGGTTPGFPLHICARVSFTHRG